MHRLRLQASPQFVQALAFDGRAYVLQEAEPYAQYWLSERERVLLSLFSTRGGRTEESALQGWLRRIGLGHALAQHRFLQRHPLDADVGVGALEMGRQPLHLDHVVVVDRRDDDLGHAPGRPGGHRQDSDHESEC